MRNDEEYRGYEIRGFSPLAGTGGRAYWLERKGRFICYCSDKHEAEECIRELNNLVKRNG